jgi:hypothetical protein
MQYYIYIYLSVLFEFIVLTYMYICWCKEEEKTKSVNGSIMPYSHFRCAPVLFHCLVTWSGNKDSELQGATTYRRP